MTAASVLVMFDPMVTLREAVKAEVNIYVQRRKDPAEMVGEKPIKLPPSVHTSIELCV